MTILLPSSFEKSSSAITQDLPEMPEMCNPQYVVWCGVQHHTFVLTCMAATNVYYISATAVGDVQA